MSPIGLYQRYFSREFNQSRNRCCHYTPSCSQYAREAIELHGLREGGEMAFMRFLRCTPSVTTRGDDPVPGSQGQSVSPRYDVFYARPDSSRAVRLAAGAARIWRSSPAKWAWTRPL